MRVTWAFLLAEWVLDLLFHDFYAGHPQSESSLVFGRPSARPLDDGVAKAHKVQGFADAPDRFQLSVFEGRNRLIRRMVEYYGTEVTKLKRIEYAGLDLEGVPPGRWRFLRDKEIVDLRSTAVMTST